MVSKPCEGGQESEHQCISYLLDTLSCHLGQSLSHISPEAVVARDPVAVDNFIEICSELNLDKAPFVVCKNSSNSSKQSQSNSHNSNSVCEILDVVRKCLKNSGCNIKIDKLEDIDDKIIIILYESITGDKINGVNMKAISKEAKVANVSKVVCALEGCLMDTSLSHICPTKIIEKDIVPIRFLVEIFEELSNYKNHAIACQYENSEFCDESQATSCKKSEFSLANCRRILQKYKIINAEQFVDWRGMNDDDDSDDDNCTMKQEDNNCKDKCTFQKSEKFCGNPCINNKGKENKSINNESIKESLKLIQKLIQSLCVNKKSELNNVGACKVNREPSVQELILRCEQILKEEAKSTSCRSESQCIPRKKFLQKKAANDVKKLPPNQTKGNTCCNGLFSRGYLMPYLLENYSDVKVSKSSIDLFCKSSRDHSKRNELILKNREKRLKAEEAEKKICESFDYNQFKIPKKNCYPMNLMAKRSLSSCKLAFNDMRCNNFLEKVEMEECIPNECCTKYKKKVCDNVAIQKLIEKCCQKPPSKCKQTFNCPVMKCPKKRAVKKCFKQGHQQKNREKISLIEKYYKEQYINLLEDMDRQKNGARCLEQDKLFREMKKELRVNIESELKNVEAAV